MKKSPHASQEALNGIDRFEILDERCRYDNHLATKRSEMLLRILFINPNACIRDFFGLLHILLQSSNAVSQISSCSFTTAS